MIAIKSLLFVSTTALLTTVSAQHGNPHQRGSQGRKTNYAALLAEAEPLEDSAEGRALLDLCMNRYGGEEKLRKLDSLRLTYSLFSIMNPDSVEMVKALRSDRHYKVERKREGRYLAGARSWRQNARGTVEQDSWGYCADLFGYLTLRMPLAAVDERFDGIRYGTRGHDPLGYLYFIKTDSLLVALGIHRESGLIMSSEGVIVRGEDPIVFENKFALHDEVGGYVFARRVVNVASGTKVGYSKLRQVEINPRLEAEDFRPRRLLNPENIH